MQKNIYWRSFRVHVFRYYSKKAIEQKFINTLKNSQSEVFICTDLHTFKVLTLTKSFYTKYLHAYKVFTHLQSLYTLTKSLHTYKVFTYLQSLYTLTKSLHTNKVFSHLQSLYTLTLCKCVKTL
jgi:succinate-acetate transporter protein